jgi:hypothetical protein
LTVSDPLRSDAICLTGSKDIFLATPRGPVTGTVVVNATIAQVEPVVEDDPNDDAVRVGLLPLPDIASRISLKARES